MQTLIAFKFVKSLEQPFLEFSIEAVQDLWSVELYFKNSGVFSGYQVQAKGFPVASIFQPKLSCSSAQKKSLKN